MLRVDKMNKKIIYVLVALSIGMFVLPLAAQSDEIYVDKTCKLGELFPGMPVWFCFNPDGGMDHSFFTYERMHEYYVPPSTETMISAVTYVYSASTDTYTP